MLARISVSILTILKWWKTAHVIISDFLTVYELCLAGQAATAGCDLFVSSTDYLSLVRIGFRNASCNYKRIPSRSLQVAKAHLKRPASRPTVESNPSWSCVPPATIRELRKRKPCLNRFLFRFFWYRSLSLRPKYLLKFQRLSWSRLKLKNNLEFETAFGITYWAWAEVEAIDPASEALRKWTMLGSSVS